MRVLIIRDHGDIEFMSDGSIRSSNGTYTLLWGKTHSTPCKYFYTELEYVLMEWHYFVKLCVDKKYLMYKGLTPLADSMNALGYRLFLVKNRFIEQ